MYASFLGISEALYLDIFHQPPKIRFFDNFPMLHRQHDGMFEKTVY